MKTILITGGLGFVGGRLVKKLSNSFDIIVSSRKIIEQKIAEQVGAQKSILHDNLLSIESFPKNIDTIIHLAALNEIDCIKFPSEAIRVNIDETRMILEHAIAAGVKNFIYFSTAHVYSQPLAGTISEISLPIPGHPYAITHRAAEDYVVAATLHNKIRGIVLRLSNAFGAPILPTVNRWTLLTNDLCRQAIEKEGLTLRSNGCQYRDFICLSDVEVVIETMVRRPMDFKKLIYNLGSGKSMRVRDMANAIADEYFSIFGKNIPIYFHDGTGPIEEPPLLFSIDRLISEGCVIRNDLKEELRNLLLFCEFYFSKS